jgi:hypothetical protein
MMVIDRLGKSLCLLGAAMALLVVLTQVQNVAAQSPPRLEAAAPPTHAAATVQPVKVKTEMGPPDPSKPAEQIKGVGAQQPAAPQPTVQLKPGEVPGISFDTLNFNFGRIPAGQDVTHDFWFTNTGNGPLEILSAKPS